MTSTLYLDGVPKINGAPLFLGIEKVRYLVYNDYSNDFTTNKEVLKWIFLKYGKS